MARTWQQLYRQAIQEHRPLPALMALARDAVDRARLESVRARIRGGDPMPLYPVCRELDRFDVKAPDEAPRSEPTPLA